MSHLYNCLSQTGFLDVAWPELDAVLDIHSQALFRGEIPTNFDKIYNMFLIAAGVPLDLVMVTKCGGIDNWARSSNPTNQMKMVEKKLVAGRKNRFPLEPSPALKILIDYIDDKESFLRSLYSLAKIMPPSSPGFQPAPEMPSPQGRSAQAKGKQKQTTGTNPLSSISMDSMESIPFLEALASFLPDALRQLDINYSSLTITCDKLFEVMEIADHGQSSGNDRGFGTILQLFMRMTDVRAEQRRRKRGDTGPSVRARPAVVFSRVLDAYVKTGRKGVPEFTEEERRWFASETDGEEQGAG
jgi:hypothetical protein